MQMCLVLGLCAGWSVNRIAMTAAKHIVANSIPVSGEVGRPAAADGETSFMAVWAVDFVGWPNASDQATASAKRC